MSSKTKTSATKEEAKPALVPKLRFPEFRGAEGWDSTRLGNLCEAITKGSTPTSYGFDYVDSGVRFVKIESLSEGSVDCSKTAYITDECNESFARSQLIENDILFSIAGALGVIAIVGRDILPANINQAIGIIRLKQGYSHRFVLHQLQADLIQTEIQRIKAGAAQPNISLTQLGDFAALLPTPAEQQKIAECLSSVDELIAAQARKVNALKTHKKGLMQQLFPREGETQPRLRFPEFQNAGEWEDDTIGAVCELYQPVTLSSSQLSMTGEHLVYGANGVIGTHNEYNHEESEIAVTCRGATCGEMTTTKAKSWITGNAMVVKPRTKKLRKDFIFQYFKNHGLKSVISGSAQPQITRTGFAPLVIFFPKPDEQARIATCLSSLDALITAETQKQEAIKTHKKGLMQQLFPSPQEVVA